jgi:hypothetical protein
LYATQTELERPRASAPGRWGVVAERSVTLASSILVGLLVARVLAPRLGHWLSVLRATNLPKEVVWGGENLKAQWYSYLFVVAIVLVSAACSVLLERLARPRPGANMLIWASAAVAGCLATSWQVSLLVLPAWALLIILLMPQVDPHARRAPATGPRALAASVVATAGLVTSWGVWITLPGLKGRLVLVAAAVPLALAALVIARRLRGPDSARRLTLDAVSAIPILFLPLIGLMRNPSPRYVVALVALSLAMRAIAAGRLAARVPLRALALVLAPWALVAAATIPLGFRDLPDINHQIHEGQRLGWINSVMDGKFLMADAGLIYAPMRDYLAAAYLGAFGTTVEQHRICSTLLNLSAVAILLAVAVRPAGGSLPIQLFFSYFLLWYTPLVCMIWYKSEFSFGWAEMNRMALAMAAVLGAAGAVRGVRPGRMPDWRRAARLFGWGAVASFSTLYSYEFGLCALAATVLTIPIDRALRPSTAPWPRRLASAAMVGASYVSGAVATIAAFLAVYALYGRASEWTRNSVGILTLVGSGEFGGWPWPVNAGSFLSIRNLTADPHSRLEKIRFCIPPAVYVTSVAVLVAKALRREWTGRSTTQLVLTLFGLASFRYTLGLSDYYHVINATMPAIFLIVIMSRDALSYRMPAPAIGGRPAPIGAMAVGVLVLASVVIGETRKDKDFRFTGALRSRIVTQLRRSESPSFGKPYRHPEIPRAGDVVMQDDLEDLIRYVRTHSSPDDPIFCRMSYMDGGEIYFLADRPNPSRFDVPEEIITLASRRELLEQLKRNPPLFVIGTETYHVGDEVGRYFDEGWEPVAQFGTLAVARRKDAREAPPKAARSGPVRADSPVVARAGEP